MKVVVLTYHAVATDAAVMCAWWTPNIAAAAILLIPLTCAVHPLALHPVLCTITEPV